MTRIKEYTEKIKKLFTKEGGSVYLKKEDAHGKNAVWLHWGNSTERPGNNVYGPWLLGFRSWLHFGSRSSVVREDPK